MKQKQMERIIIYQVLPRLFGNKKQAHVENGSIEENGCGKMADFTNKALQSIHQLGATHIWFTGILEHASQTAYPTHNIKADPASIVKGKAGSPYAIRDYYSIDPDLALNPDNRFEEFDMLIKRCHNAKLKVIIDFVPNHVARIYTSHYKPIDVIDFGITDRTDVAFDPQNNFYYMPNQSFHPQFQMNDYQEFPAKATGNDCFSATPNKNDWYETVKLNYGVDYLNGHTNHFDPRPNTWNKMLEILLYWAGKGIDGFRCDMAEMVPVQFWEWAIPAVKTHYPRIIFIGEVYQPNLYRTYLQQGGFDYLYDKVGVYDTLKAIVREERPATDLTKCWQNINDIRPHMLNFMENHDEQRIASSYFANEAYKGKPAFLVSTLMSAAPAMVYFGQELGERGMDTEGFSRCNGRTTIFDYWSLPSIQRWQNKGAWDQTKLLPAEKELREFYQKVLIMSNRELALREGDFYDLMWLNYSNKAMDCRHQFAFIRHHWKEIILCVANFSEYASEVGVIIGQHCLDFLNIPTYTPCLWQELLTGNTYSTIFDPEQPMYFPIKPYDGLVLKFNLN